jgi:flagellar basal body-associated protein FliL
MSKRNETIHEKLVMRLTRKEHEHLLNDLLEWFEDGGSKKVKDEIKKRIESIRGE